MHIEYFYYLQEIARTASFTAAANNLFMSQQSLSNIVSKIEKHYGIKIFQRSKSGTFPTQQGTEFLIEANKLLQQFESLEENFIAKADDNATIDQLSVTIDYHISLLYMANLVNEYKKHYPQRVLHVIEETNIQQIFQKVIDRQTDIALTSIYLYNYQNMPWSKQAIKQGIHFEQLYLDYLCILVSKDHPLSTRKSVSLDELTDEALIVDSNGILEEYLFPSTSPQKTKLSSSNFVFKLSSNSQKSYSTLIQETQCIAFSSKLIYTSEFGEDSNIVAIPIKDISPLATGILLPTYPAPSAKVNDFITFFKQFLGDVIY